MSCGPGVMPLAASVPSQCSHGIKLKPGPAGDGFKLWCDRPGDAGPGPGPGAAARFSRGITVTAFRDSDTGNHGPACAGPAATAPATDS
jgi:hypothetical protein